MTEFELFQALRPFYPTREYALLPQVADGTGAGAFRRCDALALGLWPSRGMALSGFEIKSYRGDWLRELKNPAKAEGIASCCNYWWIVAGNLAIVQAGELPEPWGLLAWDEKKAALVKIKAAPFREAARPEFSFIAAMLRKAQEVVTPDAVIEEARKASFAEGRIEGLAVSKGDNEAFARLKERVRIFEKTSGVDIDGWGGAGDIGAAVQQVLGGTVARWRSQLRRTAARILQDLGPATEDEDL